MIKKVKETLQVLSSTINRFKSSDRTIHHKSPTERVMLIKNPVINEIFAIIYTLSGKYIGIFNRIECFIKQKRWFIILMVLFASILLCFTIIAYTIC